MSAVADDTAVRFRFGNCNASIVVRTIVAAADHLCGAANISIALLDALEVPLAESLLALSDSSIESVVVEVDEHLVLDVRVRRHLPEDLSDIFDEAEEIIESFFVVERRSDARGVTFTGSLS